MKTIDFPNFIERYNAGEMSEAEKMWFLKELDGNKKLQEEVNLRKSADEVLKNQKIIALRNKLSLIETKREVNTPIKKLKRMPYLKAVAFISLLVLIGSITILSEKNLSSEKIMKRYYRTYEASATQRSGQLYSNDFFTKGLQCYEIYDYKNAAIYFSKVLESNPEDMQSELLNGVSNFEVKKYPEAKQSFVKVINDDNNLFIETAKWYLALCYIKNNETEKALQQLEIINNEGGLYRSKAKKIIRILK